MSFPTPRQAFETAIAKWEGAWQADPADAGNAGVVACMIGMGVLSRLQPN